MSLENGTYIGWCKKHHIKMIIGKKGKFVCLKCKDEKKERLAR